MLDAELWSKAIVASGSELFEREKFLAGNESKNT